MTAKLFTREQARSFLKENKITSAEAIGDTLIAHFKDLLQEALEAELDHELGYSKYDWKNKKSTNSRNGHSKKTVSSRYGEMKLNIPRDVEGDFEPTIVKKHERRLNPSIDDMIISMYAKGVSTRDIHAHMQKIYGLEISADMVSQITDKVLPMVQEWQNRPLEALYPIVYLDGIVFKVLQEGHIVKKTVYVVYALTVEGKKDVLGIWIGEAESAKFWMKVLVDLKNRGVADIIIASVDGLKGFEAAISSVFPNTEVQQCIVHQIRNSTKFVSYKDRKSLCGDLKLVYTAVNEEAALIALAQFEEKWSKKYPHAGRGWRENWSRLATFFKYPEDIRRIIYTTNAIEGLNRIMRKATKTRSSFPTEEALTKILYLVIVDTLDKWTMPMHNWSSIINQLSVYYGDRIKPYL